MSQLMGTVLVRITAGTARLSDGDADRDPGHAAIVLGGGSDHGVELRGDPKRFGDLIEHAGPGRRVPARSAG